MISGWQVSWYIAEFYNTLTNLAMIAPASYGIHKVRKHKLETRWTLFLDLRLLTSATTDRFLISYVMLLTVGVGSSLFHMTLKYDSINKF